MTIDEQAEREAFLRSTGHALVLGGPGSGKTTLALQKAVARIGEGLEPGQMVLFLSFSRAAVARIGEASKAEAQRHQRGLLNIQTFHSFFWEVLRSNAYLLGAPRRLSILLPQDERALCRGIDQEDRDWPIWLAERERLFLEEGRVAFDLFAVKAAALLATSAHLRRLIAQRFPLIVVDEAQDTSPPAWRCIELVAPLTQVVCLADLDQQIFDHLPGIGPERIAAIEAALMPLKIDLGGENRRSPGTEIVEFGNDILVGRVRGAGYAGVSSRMYNPKGDASTRLRMALGVLQRCVRQRVGSGGRNLAILVPYESAARRISIALSAGPKPVRHKLLFDQAEAMLSARLAAFLLEPRHVEREKDIAVCLDLLAAVKNAGGGSGAPKLHDWARRLRNGQRPRAKLVKTFEAIYDHLARTPLVGNPRADWLTVRRALRDSTDAELLRVAGHLEYLVAFNRGKRISSNLSALWERGGQYTGAREALDAALSEDQILGSLEDPLGLQVMTIHKSKGKQFDGVLLVREGVPMGAGQWRSSFVWRDDPHPHPRSRKILRVAITRARHHVLMLEPAYPDCPLMAGHNL